MKSKVYNCIDAELGKTLHTLFQDGEKSVSVMHPIEGELIIKKDEFYEHINNLRKAVIGGQKKELSPAKKIIEKKKQIIKEKYMSRKILKELKAAKISIIDAHGEDNFGFDIHGNKLDIDEMTFIQKEKYPKEFLGLENEIGSYIDLEFKKLPIRLVDKQ